MRVLLRRIAPAAVAAVLLAGCTEGGSEARPDAGGPPLEDATVAVTGLDTIAWDVEHLQAPAGEIVVALTCQGGVNHNFVIEETDELVAECGPGETDVGRVELEPGTYTYVCTIPGHERHMRGTLTVR